jgi:surfeit locus 1 family protein
MSRRTLGFVVIALASSLGFVRLGFWQLSRLRERRARNAIVAARLKAPLVPFREAMQSLDSARYRRVVVRGRLDYSNELLLVSRPRNGSPGVYLLTPLRQAGDSEILILRGWVYSPDGKTVVREQWHEGTDATLTGFIDDFTPVTGPVSVVGDSQAVRHLVLDSIRTRLPYPLQPRFVVQTSDSVERPDRPARISPPVLDDGPHLSYAIQWFAFALIAWVGVIVVIRKERGRASGFGLRDSGLRVQPHDSKRGEEGDEHG